MRSVVSRQRPNSELGQVQLREAFKEVEKIWVCRRLIKVLLTDSQFKKIDRATAEKPNLSEVG